LVKDVWQWTLGILNALLILIKKVSACFEWLKADELKRMVWSKEKPLTPRGMTG
jgi:hypothetical protein